mmetsp:Transcript_160298/g.282826  ORF Transcript_160298/g.282826 Transcript_160298/m.282826 type:complete len:793 (-) Transcript_160298:66-2444(-)
MAKPASVKEAEALVAVADGHLSNDSDEEALTAATDALAFFREKKNGAGIASALSVIIKCYCVQDRKKEAITMAEEELAAFRKAGTKVGEAKMLLALAEACSKGSEESLSQAKEALSLFRDVKDTKMEAGTLLALVTMYISSCGKEVDLESGVKDASQAASDALELYQKLGDQKGEAAALHATGMVAAAEDKFEEAIIAAEEALEIAQDIKDYGMQVVELNAIAQWYAEEGKAGKSLQAALESLDVARMNNCSMAKEGMAWQSVVKAYLMKGHTTKAVSEAKKGFDRFTDLGASKQIDDAHVTMFLAYYYNGMNDEAMVELEAAQEVAANRGNKAMEAELLCGSATTFMANGELEKAETAAKKAMELSQEDESWGFYLGAMNTLVDLKIESTDYQIAIDIAEEARATFEKAGASSEEGQACLTLAQANIKSGDFSMAGKYAKAAQELAVQEEDEEMEATALLKLTDIYIRDAKFQKASRSADQAKRMFRSLEKPAQEANAQNLGAQAALNETIKKITAGTLSDVKDSWDKAFAAAEEAVELAKAVPAADSGSWFLAMATATLGQVLIYRKESQAGALTSVQAVNLFIENDDEVGAAYGWVWAAQGAIGLELWPNAKKDAGEGLKIFKRIKDDAGIAYTESVLAQVEKLAPPPEPVGPPPGWEQWMAQQGGAAQWKVPGKKMPGFAQVADAGPAAGGGSSRQKTGGTLQLSAGISEDVVMAKVKDTVLAIIGDEDELEVDTPLMEAGLTSSTAVVLRDELMEDLPGINLPPTLIFDYPSTTAIVEFIMEKAGKM